MTISAEELKSILMHQQAQFEASQLKLIETLTRQFSIQPGSKPEAVKPSASVDAIVNSITEFSYDPDAGLTFDSWFKRYEDIFRVDLVENDDAWKVRLLLRKLGTTEHTKYTNFILPKNARDCSFDETVQCLSKIFGEQSSLFNKRYQCLQLTKNAGDDYVTYASIVNRECEKFDYKSLTADQFKCLIFVCGLQSSSDAEIRTRLLSKLEQDPQMTLQNITNECQILLNLKHDTSMLEKQSTSSPAVFQTTSKNQVQKETGRTKKQDESRPPSACWRCGEWHFVRVCPYLKHVCQKCHKLGHRETHCRSKNLFPHVQSPKTTRFRRRPGKRSTVNATRSDDFLARRKYVKVSINGTPVRLQLDTASDITIISKQILRSIGSPPIQPTTHVAFNASGGQLQLSGEFQCEISVGPTHATGIVYVTNRSNLNLLGLDWIHKLQLLNAPLNQICNNLQVQRPSEPADKDKKWLTQLQRKFPTVFQNDLGKCTKAKAKLVLVENAKPVFRPKRPVPYAALPIVEAELDRLEREGVIQHVNYSEWAAPIVVVKKPNGKVRICADYSTGLNEALSMHQYPLPVPEDLFARLNGGAHFAKLDLSDAYLQIEVDDMSKELLTINTHRGLYQYNRLPFGVKSAPAIFQQIMDTMLAGLPGVAAYLDDIIIKGSTKQELFTRVQDVLSRISDYGFTLRADKCNFCMESVKYLGFIIDQYGRRPDPSNIDAIKHMPPPDNVSKLRSFLGLVSHYSAFVPEMHQLRGPLNELLVKDHHWTWSLECQNAFDTLKTILCSDLLLTHFNPELEIVVAADASDYGIGAVISHIFPNGSEKAVAHASRSITKAERNYGQIEKEALAIVFAVKRFHKMLYGRRFTLLTDHKPLLAIFGSKKGIPIYTANRLQRWATILLGYDFNIKYRSTDKIGQADALSRLISTQHREPEDIVVAQILVEPEINQVVADACSTLPVTFDMVRKATRTDPTLQQAINYHRSGWPKKVTSSELQQLHQRRGALSIVNDCLLFSDRIVIPTILQNRVLRQFHTGHPGMNRMKAMARSYVYWPHMDSHIERLSKNCTRCALASKQPIKTELQSWPLTTEPWSRVHVDFAGPIDGQHFLIVVDSHSKWPEVITMPRTSTDATISALRKIFYRFGVPHTLVSDNGSQFTSSQFADFCHRNAIAHIRSPPYHPQSNGQAERFVDTFKRALQKMKGEGTLAENIDKFLLMYRTTTNSQTPNAVSPAEILFKRKIRVPHDVIKPQKNQKLSRNTQMEQQFNRRHRASRRIFHIGQKVLVRDYRLNHPKWTTGNIRKRCGNVIYEVQVGAEIWVRHANQILNRTAELKRQLPLDILMESCEAEPTENSIASPSPAVRESNTTQRPKRTRKFVSPMQVDPRLKSYDSSSRGEVLGRAYRTYQKPSLRHNHAHASNINSNDESDGSDKQLPIQPIRISRTKSNWHVVPIKPESC